jgi:threonine/homoserine/homoserine lactone efflux protein
MWGLGKAYILILAYLPDFLWLLFSAVLYTIVPKIQLPMKILGVSYMVYIILKTIIPSKEQKSKNINGNSLIGALLQLINPKIIIYGITAMSSYILPYYKDFPILLFFALSLTFTGCSGTICWALFGSLFSILFNKHKKIVNIIMVTLLLYCVVSLFL